MQLAFTQKQEAFRQEIRGFLKQELPDDWEGLEEGDEYEGEGLEFTRRMAKTLANKGWLTLGLAQRIRRPGPPDDGAGRLPGRDGLQHGPSRHPGHGSREE